MGSGPVSPVGITGPGIWVSSSFLAFATFRSGLGAQLNVCWMMSACDLASPVLGAGSMVLLCIRNPAIQKSEPTAPKRRVTRNLVTQNLLRAGCWTENVDPRGSTPPGVACPRLQAELQTSGGGAHLRGGPSQEGRQAAGSPTAFRSCA